MALGAPASSDYAHHKGDQNTDQKDREENHGVFEHIEKPDNPGQPPEQLPNAFTFTGECRIWRQAHRIH